MQTKADLHMHTTASDGGLAPGDMVRAANARGMSLIAITDHDTLAGLPEAMEAAKACGIRLVPGIEISCGDRAEVHMLGYGMAPQEPGLAAFLSEELEERLQRMQRMLRKCRQFGMDITMDDVKAEGKAFVGRMNLAIAMVDKGYVRSVREAFARFIGEGGPVYENRQRVSVCQGIKRLKAAGAITSLAHPGRMRMDRQTLLSLLPSYMDAGLDGIEAYHESHSLADARAFDRLARRHELLVTGGSDCHGRVDGPAIGDHLSKWQTVDADVQALLLRIEHTKK